MPDPSITPQAPAPRMRRVAGVDEVYSVMRRMRVAIGWGEDYGLRPAHDLHGLSVKVLRTIAADEGVGVHEFSAREAVPGRGAVVAFISCTVDGITLYAYDEAEPARVAA